MVQLIGRARGELGMDVTDPGFARYKLLVVIAVLGILALAVERFI